MGYINTAYFEVRSCVTYCRHAVVLDVCNHIAAWMTPGPNKPSDGIVMQQLMLDPCVLIALMLNSGWQRHWLCTTQPVHKRAAERSNTAADGWYIDYLRIIIWVTIQWLTSVLRIVATISMTSQSQHIHKLNCVYTMNARTVCLLQYCPVSARELFPSTLQSVHAQSGNLDLFVYSAEHVMHVAIQLAWQLSNHTVSWPSICTVDQASPLQYLLLKYVNGTQMPEMSNQPSYQLSLTEPTPKQTRQQVP